MARFDQQMKQHYERENRSEYIANIEQCNTLQKRFDRAYPMPAKRNGFSLWGGILIGVIISIPFIVEIAKCVLH